MLGHENMNPVPFATAHECYNSLWRRQWASQWAVLVRGQSVKHSRQARWHEASKWLLASTFCLPDSAQIANEQNKQKAHCGNAQEFLCKKAKRNKPKPKNIPKSYQRQSTHRRRAQEWEILAVGHHQKETRKNNCRWPQNLLACRTLAAMKCNRSRRPLWAVFFFSAKTLMSKNCEAAPELQVEQQLELAIWAAVWSLESVARRSTHQLTASATVATSGRLHRVNKYYLSVWHPIWRPLAISLVNNFFV